MKNNSITVDGVILAAGSASRMGEAKQLLFFRGKRLLELVLEHAQNSALRQVIVVLGYEAKQIRRKIDFRNARVIVNADYAMGQSTSVCCGLSMVSATCDAAMFLLGDQPLISSSVIDSLIDSYEREKAPITVPVYHGKRGNPVIIDRSLFPALETLAGDTGAKQLFGAYESRIHYVEVTAPEILLDIDTQADYLHLKQLWENADEP